MKKLFTIFITTIFLATSLGAWDKESFLESVENYDLESCIDLLNEFATDTEKKSFLISLKNKIESEYDITIDNKDIKIALDVAYCELEANNFVYSTERSVPFELVKNKSKKKGFLDKFKNKSTIYQAVGGALVCLVPIPGARIIGTGIITDAVVKAVRN